MALSQSSKRLNRRFLLKGLNQSYPELKSFSPAIRYLWRVHLQGCFRTGRENKLTVPQFAKLIRSPCVYCGTPPNNTTKRKTSANISYNGIDRIRNDEDYSVENSAPCCKTCNSMKSALTVSEFLKHVQKVAALAVTLDSRARDPSRAP